MNRRRPCWPRPSRNRVIAALAVFAAVGIVSHCGADDSLRSALEAISDKIGESPSAPRMVYLTPDDGQPEDIGYGYQKNLRNLENMFEPGAPVPDRMSKDEMVVKFLDYLSKDSPPEVLRQLYKTKPAWSKKSIFRERVDSDVPDNLQQLKYDRYAAIPSAFRERYKTDPGLVQDYKTGTDEQDDYLHAVNSLLDKYIEENVQGMSDEELEELLQRTQEDKRDLPADNELLQNLQYYGPGYKRNGGAADGPAKRQFLFIPAFPRFQHPRKYNKHQNRWMKSRPMKRSKKNVVSANDTTATTHTDPKVAAELNSIFLGSERNNDYVNATANDSVNKTSKPDGGGADVKKIEMKKKSIDWSNYFGYDRKKKSIQNIPSDDTILNQYMRTYGKETEDNEANTLNNLKNDRLMWLEDELIDDALKYTGANQGINDPEEINSVKNQVLSNLNQAYNIEKLIQDKARHENNEMQEKQLYDEKSEFVLPAENNSQPMNSLDSAEPHKEVDHKECNQLQQITQDCLDLGGSAGDLMLPVCTLYRVCRSCESGQSECEQRFILSSHELCSRAPLCRYFSRRMLQLMQDRPLQMECHKCMINFLQNEEK